jgi:hypothetical protein
MAYNLATSKSDGSLRAGGATAAATLAMPRIASSGTLEGKSFGAGVAEAQDGMEKQLTYEMEKLLKLTLDAEKKLKATDKVQRMPWVAKEKLSLDINGESVQVDKAMYAQLYKMDKETGIVERDPFNVPIRRVSEGALMKKKGGEEAALLGNLEEELERTENEIRADKAGLMDMERIMSQIEKERSHLRYLNMLSHEFLGSMASEEALGGILKQYGAAEKGLQRAYHQTRANHAAGMQMLQDEFDYHPAYKRGYVRKKWTTSKGDVRENLVYNPGEFMNLAQAPRNKGIEFSGKYFTPLRDPMKRR